MHLLFCTVLVVVLFYLFIQDKDPINLLYFWISLALMCPLYGRIASSIISFLKYKYQWSEASYQIFNIIFIIYNYGFFIRTNWMIWPFRVLSYMNPLKYIFQTNLLIDYGN